MDKKYVLISVFNKGGIAQYASELVTLGYTVVSSGGTANFLKQNNIEVIDVADLTHVPPLLDHRVVTLHPAIHSGLLAKDTPEHKKELDDHGYLKFDLLVVDFYPLSLELQKPDATFDSIIEKIDIGGPTMVKSIAKAGRPVVCNVEDRARVLEWLKAGEPNKEEFMQALRAKAFMTVVNYYKDIAEYLSNGTYQVECFENVATFCYGENQPQSPSYLWKPYAQANDTLGLSSSAQLSGKEKSFNNGCDFDSGLQTITHIAAGFDTNFTKVPNIALGLKHGNACGASASDNPQKAIEDMLAGNLLSIFGGSVMFNFALDENLAKVLLTYKQDGKDRLLDMVVAPDFSDGALELLSNRAKCRVVKLPALANLNKNSLDTHLRSRYIRGGKMTQPNYMYVLDFKDTNVETIGTLSDQQKYDMVLAWAITATSTSNTIALARDGMLLGNGVGQQDRVGAAKLAIGRALDGLQQRGLDGIGGAVVASDSFFPFPDGPAVLVEAGVSAIFATNGSRGDASVREYIESKKVSLCWLPDSIGRGFYKH